MITICKKCGKKYQLDPAKIKSTVGRFICKSCGHQNIVRKSHEKPLAPPFLSRSGSLLHLEIGRRNLPPLKNLKKIKVTLIFSSNGSGSVLA